ncbi:cytidylyltransferase domain-containing protein [Candidatus Margulisiibacteriota bacterium]
MLLKKNNKIALIIQARMGSSRLPGKVMKPVLGIPLLEILISRVKKSKKADIIIVATSDKATDDVIEELVNKTGVYCYRGSEDDVLNRYYESARKYEVDVVVRITGDCPLMDPRLIDEMLDYYHKCQPIEYVSNTLNRSFPRGFDVEIFSFKSLKDAANKAKELYQREHVTPYIYEHNARKNYENNIDQSQYRVTVDTQEDFDLVSAIFQNYNSIDIDYAEIIDYLRGNPGAVKINQHVKQKGLK